MPATIVVVAPSANEPERGVSVAGIGMRLMGGTTKC